MSLSVSGDSQSLLVQLLQAANRHSGASGASNASATSPSSAGNSSFAIDAAKAVGLSPALISILTQFSSGSGSNANGPSAPPPGTSSASGAASSSDPSGTAGLISTLKADLASIARAFQSSDAPPTNGGQTDAPDGSTASGSVGASASAASTSGFGLPTILSVVDAYASHGSTEATGDNGGSA